MFEKTFLLDVGFTNEKKENILEYIVSSAEKQQKKYYIVTPNPELLVIAHKNSEYKNILNNAKLALVDGIGVVLAAKFLQKPLHGRISGVDLVETLCQAVAKKPITVGFLGAGEGVAEKTAECLMAKYPGLNVAFVAQEWNAKSFQAEKIDILFAAFGSPKQEKWIAQNLQQLPVTVAIGVGGAFDFISGIVVRAPVFVRKMGLEWLFRLLVQPWRIKRQLRLIEFVYLVLREKSGRK